MAGSITVTSSEVASSGGIRKYSVAWTSDAAGAVSGNTFDMATGTIVAVEFVPSAVAAPTDLYDVTCLDDESVNIFDDGTGAASIGANLSATAASYRVPFMGGGGTVTYVRQWLHGGSYQPVVANAGAAKSGVIDVYVAPGVL